MVKTLGGVHLRVDLRIYPRRFAYGRVRVVQYKHGASAAEFDCPRGSSVERPFHAKGFVRYGGQAVCAAGAAAAAAAPEAASPATQAASAELVRRRPYASLYLALAR